MPDLPVALVALAVLLVTCTLYTLHRILRLLILLGLDLDLPLRLATLLALSLRTAIAILAVVVVRHLGLSLLLSALWRTLRGALRLPARCGLAYSTTWRASGSAGDLGALDGVPACTETAGVFVAKLCGDFVDVELERWGVS